ncbi:MAG: hypothetical protein RH860_15070 [Cytophagales bacterium]
MLFIINLQTVVSFTTYTMDLFSAVYITFYAVTGLALFGLLFNIYKAYQNKSKAFLSVLFVGAIIFVWLSLQAYLANNNFYLSDTKSLPPRFLLAIVPPLLFIIFILIYKKERILKMPGKWMTFFHVIRVPIELVLYGLFMEKLIPEIMTFSGRNYDIIIGLSAPVMAMLFYSNTSIHKRWIQIWNVIGIAFLVNVVFYGIFSTPYPFQMYGLEQANIAVLQYPIIWLPSFLVPAVLFFHLACLMQLLNKNHPGY